MNLEFFIARHIVGKYSGNFTGPIVRIAVSSIAIGLAIMIISVAVVTGYQREIRNKVIGFGSHIQISHYDSNASFESAPISSDRISLSALNSIDGVRHVQVYATKAGIIKTEEQIQGVVLKGISNDYDWSFFNDKIVEGESFIFNDSVAVNDIIISKKTADNLNIKLSESVRIYFVVDGESMPRGRRFNVSGIYETGLEDLDKLFALCDIRHIQKLNQWDSGQISGFEVLVEDFDKLDEIAADVYDIIGYDLDARTIKQEHPEIFDWLGLFDMNVYIILTLMVMVAGFNMISALLILILEKTSMIGVLKTLGAVNASVRRIFIYNAAYLIIRGLLLGNILAFLLCYIQIETGFITLNQESYYVSVVPVNINVWHIIALNAGTLLMCILMLLLPSYIVARITPLKAIRFS